MSLSAPFASVRFRDLLTMHHHQECVRHQHPSVVHGLDHVWSTLMIAPSAVLHAVACLKAACHLRTLHGQGLTALLWLVPVWTDDELSAVVHHPDVRADTLVASELRLQLHERCRQSPELTVLGPGVHTTFEAIDRANRALSRVDLSHPRGITLTEHMASIFEEHEDHHSRAFEAMVRSLTGEYGHLLVQRLVSYMPNDRCRTVCDDALKRRANASSNLGMSSAS